MSHTPGPWYVGHLDKNGQAVIASQHIEIATCWHHCVGSIEQQMHANARLMATAPEMLADLREASKILRHYEVLHRAKGTTESDAKAKVNAAFASRFEATISRAIGE